MTSIAPHHVLSPGLQRGRQVSRSLFTFLSYGPASVSTKVPDQFLHLARTCSHSLLPLTFLPCLLSPHPEYKLFREVPLLVLSCIPVTQQEK